jgi:EmrB/QacA subfamily drug resistance transporter
MTASAPLRPADHRPQHLGIALAVISTAQLMVILDATIVNVALPSIQRGLHFSLQNLVWVTSAYSLAFGGLLLFGGRTGDLFGRRRMFMIGIALFAVASLLGGFAQTDIWLIVTRAAQGAGGAIASPTALALITTNFPEGPPRNRAMGVYAAMSGAGAAAGLLAGGLLTDLASWRWVLFVNVPIGLAVLALTPRVLRESESRPGQLDLLGAITVTAGMGLLVYGLTNAASHSWGASSTIAYLTVAAAILIFFVLLEARTEHALMPLWIFADRNRSGAYLMMLCIGAALFGVFYFLTQYMQNILGYSPLRAGLAFLPVAVTIGVCAQIAARLVGRIGARVPLLIGPTAAIAGLFWLSRLTVDSGYLNVLGPFLCIGVGMGFSFVPLTLTAVSGVPRSESGLASALLNTGQQLGGAIGLALLSTVSVNAIRSRAGELAARHGGHLTAGLQHQAVVHGYDTGFIVGGLIACGALVVSVAVLRLQRGGTDGGQPAPVAAAAST